MSEAQLRALLAPQRGWRLASLRQVWYQRPDRAASSGGAYTMAWWCRAEACDMAPVPAASSAPSADRAPGHGLLPRRSYRYQLDGWRAAAAAAVAAAATGTAPDEAATGEAATGEAATGEAATGEAATGELRLVLARSNGDPRIGEGLHVFTTSWRLICAWRADGGQDVCFGIGSDGDGGRMWGEDFFMLDAES
jgi:hypothetical protein